MKTLTLFILLLSLQSQALVVEFIGPCSKKSFAAQIISDVQGQSVEALTRIAAEKRNVPMSISQLGMFEFLGHEMNPKELTKIDHVEVGFGWCYQINGQVSSTSARDLVPNQQGRITWVHSFSLKVNGEWIQSAACIPTHTQYSELFCK